MRTNSNTLHLNWGQRLIKNIQQGYPKLRLLALFSASSAPPKSGSLAVCEAMGIAEQYLVIQGKGKKAQAKVRICHFAGVEIVTACRAYPAHIRNGGTAGYCD